MDPSSITRLETHLPPTHPNDDHAGIPRPVLARMEREHRGEHPWMLTVLPDSTDPGAGRYATRAATVEQAQRILDRVSAATLRWQEAHRALDLSYRQEVQAALTAVGATQDTLDGLDDTPVVTLPVTVAADAGDPGQDPS